MRLPGRIRLFAVALLSPTAALAQTASVELPPGLDDYVAQVMETFEVPGVSLAIVKDGETVLARGHGIRRLGETTPVDGQTLFGIASNTKAFTATALGLLVEDGKLEWDAPVVRYLPWFQLSDPYVTRELTIRDLLVHRSGLGLGAGDLLWWPPTTYTRREIARRLRHIPLSTSFRSTYAYDNVLYLIAGEVIEAVSGWTWEDFVAKRILAKVGMKGSTVRHAESNDGANVATPHARVEGSVRPIKPFVIEDANPAGGINSNAEDMARWLTAQLDSGRVAKGKRLFSRYTTRQLWTIVTPIPIRNPAPELAALRPNFQGYALGFRVLDYRGRKIVTHTGYVPGYMSQVTMVPELKLGISVLTNQESGSAFRAITNRILDHFLGAPSTDWLEAYEAVWKRRAESVAADERRAVSARDSTSRPSLPLKAYAGTYTDPWYGDVTIMHKDGKLVMRFAHTPVLVGDLVHYQYDTFLARWWDRELRADAYVSFALNPDGSIDQVKLRPASPTVDFSFDFQDLLLTPAARAPAR